METKTEILSTDNRGFVFYCIVHDSFLNVSWFFSLPTEYSVSG